MRLRSAAHPRAGGENSQGGPAQASARGSSPRGRGKLRCSLQVQGHCRLIPARAGKTRLATKRAARSTAHPRAGGENERHRRCDLRRFGSSPRGRGKHDRPREAAANSGLIPARAGKTAPRPTPATSPWAHPRMGGENLVTTVYRLSPGGSSPHGRGKHTRREITRDEHGLIPARAGKTLLILATSVTVKAHPRAGGENKPGRVYTRAFLGSSPRGRGKPPN